MTPTGKIHGSTYQGMEAGIAPLTFAANDPLEDFVLSIPTNLGSIGLDVLVPKEVALLLRDTARVLLYYKL